MEPIMNETATNEMTSEIALQPIDPAVRGAFEETDETKCMKAHFAFFGLGSFLYALFYTLCMFRNPSGVTYLLYIVATLVFFSLVMKTLGHELKKGSAFYMISMVLLSISTFCTDDSRIIFFNKWGIFLLMMSLLLNQFYDTSKWKLGKYLSSILMMLGCIGEMDRPFSDGIAFLETKDKKRNTIILYGLLGVTLATPILVIVILLLSSADAVFREIADSIFRAIRVENLFGIAIRVVLVTFVSYLLIAFLCNKRISEEVKNRRTGEPVLAITVTALLSVVYLLFSGIQIIYLFIGNMQLPEGYTYAEYAREGFFQLLAVSILNLVIVLCCMSFFRESKVLKVILTIMSACTFIMIASSVLRMMIYIRFYYLTFLRILVLWALALLFVLFMGVIISIYKEHFPLFQYSMVVVTVFYLVFSFLHPDYLIAKVNLANTSEDKNQRNEFFLADYPYNDFHYIRDLSTDAAPVISAFLADQDNINEFDSKNPVRVLAERYSEKVYYKTGGKDIRKWNVSRWNAGRVWKGVK